MFEFCIQTDDPHFQHWYGASNEKPLQKWKLGKVWTDKNIPYIHKNQVIDRENSERPES